MPNAPRQDGATVGEAELRTAREALARHDYAAAAGEYERVWSAICDHRNDLALLILTEWAEAAFRAGDFQTSIARLEEALAECPAAADNVHVRFRLGQAYFEVGNTSKAAEWMIGAYLMAPRDLFVNEPPKYLEFVKSELTARGR